ncbi:MAG: lysine biosynthesis protein LysX [Acidobacteria bacterium]|nr:lysine biosynthesis protein LysX [Acidobacteriota bacterium]
MRIGVLYSRVRPEEKLLFRELERRRAEVELIDDRKVVLSFGGPSALEPALDFDVVFDRSISHSRALVHLKVLADRGIPTVNRIDVALNCGDKVRTSSLLQAAGVPTPDTRVASTPQAALSAIEELGYPVVLKPAVGSWGRLIARINDRDAAEAVLEHKSTLGSYQHSIFYLQRYVDKPERDIRAFVAGGETICAIYRQAPHWITNTARGARTTNCPVTPDLEILCRQAADAVGGGLVAVDLVEDRHRGLLVLEVNHTMEFRNSIEPTGVDIPARMIDFVEQVGAEGQDRQEGT